jgi:hypothetical protein
MVKDGTMNHLIIIWEENVKNNGTSCIHTCYFMDNGDDGVK